VAREAAIKAIGAQMPDPVYRAQAERRVDEVYRDRPPAPRPYVAERLQQCASKAAVRVNAAAADGCYQLTRFANDFFAARAQQVPRPKRAWPGWRPASTAPRSRRRSSARGCFFTACCRGAGCAEEIRMKLPLNRLSAATLVRMIAAGECSPESVTRSFLDAIAEHEPTVQAYAWFDADGALATARALHLSARRGPLHGLPVAVKDNIDTADAPTAHGSVIYSGHRPQTDAACVALLKDAGAYVLGKTVLAEFANFTPGPTRNPHAPAHTAGGSSSGSAAA
jgi:hypothetical protein